MVREILIKVDNAPVSAGAKECYVGGITRVYIDGKELENLQSFDFHVAVGELPVIETKQYIH